jgi:shikimate dehydrogenase
VANRSRARAAELVRRHAALAASQGVELAASALDDCGERFDIVVNATASSLAGVAVPVSAKVLAAGSLALDMMYGPAARQFLRWADTNGARSRDGLGMLVEQAALAFHFWRGVMPDTQPVLALLRERWSETA